MTSPTDSLVSRLNTLLTNLNLTGISLQSPTDLIPSLLIAILESILESRLPLPPSHSQRDKVQSTKIFLGVLENDVLQTDVGLSEVDPRELARGAWDEVVFIGEVLCWLGQQRGFLPPETVESLREVEDASVMVPRLRRSRQESAMSISTMTNSAHTDLSIQSVRTDSDADTTITAGSSGSHSPAGSPSPASPSPSPSPPHRPRCIHELEEPSSIDIDDEASSIIEDSDDFCDCANPRSPSPSISPPMPVPIRYGGWITKIDDSLELELFEASKRNKSTARTRRREREEDGGSGSRSWVTAEWTYPRSMSVSRYFLSFFFVRLESTHFRAFCLHIYDRI